MLVGFWMKNQAINDSLNIIGYKFFQCCFFPAIPVEKKLLREAKKIPIHVMNPYKLIVVQSV